MLCVYLCVCECAYVIMWEWPIPNTARRKNDYLKKAEGVLSKGKTEKGLRDNVRKHHVTEENTKHL